MKYSKLPKEVRSIITPTLWDPYHYISVKLRRAYEEKIPKHLNANMKYKILDYGCGDKPYEYLFENLVDKYVGVDVGNNPKAEHIIEPGEKLKFGNEEFDVVLSSQVLEHVEDVSSYLSECNRVLKPGGILFLSTHGTWQYHASPYDYYRWTSLGLKTVISKHKFEVIDFVSALGQLAVTSQLRLSFFNSFADMIGTIGKILLAPLSLFYQFKMMFEDFITPNRVKERDAAIYLVIAKKIQNGLH